MPKQKISGKIISDKMQKTVVVQTERIIEHPKYKRKYKFSTKYKAHVEGSGYKEGDVVVIEECRPLSKDKRWKVIKKISSPTEEQPLVELEKISDSLVKENLESANQLKTENLEEKSN